MNQDSNTPNQKSQRTLEATDFQVPGAESSVARFQYRPIHAILLLSAFALIGFIAFITLARSIQITAVARHLATPDKLHTQSADIILDSIIKLPIGNRYLVLPGVHTVWLEADGFQAIQQTIEVSSQRHQQFEIELLRMPGVLEIPVPDGAVGEVWIDKKMFSALPGAVNDVPAGSHSITVDLDLYRAINKTMVVKGEGKVQRLLFDFEPAWAEYQIATQPEGAQITIDGKAVGKSPAVIRVEEGTRILQVNANGYKPFQQELGVVASKDTQLPIITLTPADGRLKLESQPSQAAIVINDEYRGVTPLTVAVVPDQAQHLRVYKAGYQLFEQDITLRPAEEKVEQISLEADLIPVEFSVTPQDAMIVVDGESRGTGSQTLALSSLPHAVSVRKAGFVTQNLNIVPTQHHKQLVSVQLLTREQDYWSKIPEQYTNKLGHEMKLFRAPGQVTLGSSRREDGRRANEAVYTAKLNKAFYVALHETTNKQFRQFKATHNSGNYKRKSLNANKAPVANVSWQHAALYCNWLSEQEGLAPFYQTKAGYVSGYNAQANGYRLLTEAEWAWLARTRNDNQLMYPWGNDKHPGNNRVGNFADKNAASLVAFTLVNYDDGYSGPAPVGRFPANHNGVFDLGGNVSEWVNDWYSAKGSRELASDGKLVDPLGPEIGEFHVVRGASWAKGHLPQLRLAYRGYGAKGQYDVGFRVARYAGVSQTNK